MTLEERKFLKEFVHPEGASFCVSRKQKLHEQGTNKIKLHPLSRKEAWRLLL